VSRKYTNSPSDLVSLGTVLTINPAAQSVVAGGAALNFTICSNTTWSWSCDTTWLTSCEASSQSGNQAFSHTVMANAGAGDRTAVITLTGSGLAAASSPTARASGWSFRLDARIVIGPVHQKLFIAAHPHGMFPHSGRLQRLLMRFLLKPSSASFLACSFACVFLLT
jgi:hypothetical protein